MPGPCYLFITCIRETFIIRVRIFGRARGPFRANVCPSKINRYYYFRMHGHVDEVLAPQRQSGLNGIRVAKDNTGRKISLSKRPRRSSAI